MLVPPVVFLLWGNHAQKYARFINTDKHYIISGGHPSTLGGMVVNNFLAARTFYGLMTFWELIEVIEALRLTKDFAASKSFVYKYGRKIQRRFKKTAVVHFAFVKHEDFNLLSFSEKV